MIVVRFHNHIIVRSDYLSDLRHHPIIKTTSTPKIKSIITIMERTGTMITLESGRDHNLLFIPLIDNIYSPQSTPDLTIQTAYANTGLN